MRRRVEVEPETGVPAVLADGPHVPTWCHPTILARLDAMEEGDPNRKDAVWDAMLSARREWRNALDQWAKDNGRDFRELGLSFRRPYW